MVKGSVFSSATVCLLLPLISLLSFSIPFQNLGNIYYSQDSTIIPLKEFSIAAIRYAFASEDSEDSDEENVDEENVDEENVDEENVDEETPDEENGGNRDVGDSAPLQGNGTTGDLGASGARSGPSPGTPGDLGVSPPNNTGSTGDLNPSIVTNGRTSDLGSSQTGGGDAGVFGGNTGTTSRTFTHNAEKIAQELTGKTPLEISQYPISALSTNDLKLVLGFLDPINLAKVLLNISPQDLLTIQGRLSSDYSFVNILNRLSLSDRTDVERRLSIVQ
jgi:hypothetical protein